MMNDDNPFYRSFMALDSWLSSAGFEVVDFIQRSWSAYASWLERFRIRGLTRIAIDLTDDALTLGMGVAVIVAVVAIPPFNNTGDIWNQGRQYAVTFTDQNGEIIGRRGIRQDDAMPIEEIPPHVIQAVLATEDARFFEHFGVDLQGHARAIVVNARANDVVQGGSSLTQQVAKNLFLSPERTISRKVHEAFLALWIEARLTKDQILKLYLDRSYLGGGNYGVEAASQFYFGKSIRDVNLSEAAMLAGLFKAPSKYAPHHNPEAARARANMVLYRMLDLGLHHPGGAVRGQAQPAEVAEITADSPDWFLDWAYRDTLDVIDGRTSRATMSSRSRQRSISACRRRRSGSSTKARERKGRTTVHPGGSVTMTPDGAVRAIVGGQDYEQASSTAPPMRCASRDRRSSPSSIWRRSRPAIKPTSDRRRCRSRSPTGRRRTTRGNMPAAPRSAMPWHIPTIRCR